jgi:hypothetical protein
MPRNRRSADREPRGDISGREFPALKILEYLAPSWVSECPENPGVIVHDPILANVLITIKPPPKRTR